MKKCLFVLLSLLPLCALAQPRVRKLTPKNIPSAIEYNGNIILAIQWKDNVGENIVVLSETDKAHNITRPETDLFEATLEARHYVLADEYWRPKWKVFDQVTECGKVLSANFEKEALEVTDLDEDGIGEVWMLYKIGCHKEKEPSLMKLIMYESETRYSMKGLSNAKTKKNVGDYTIDAAFKNGPAKFKEYAMKFWDDYATHRPSRYDPRQFR